MRKFSISAVVVVLTSSPPRSPDDVSEEVRPAR